MRTRYLSFFLVAVIALAWRVAGLAITTNVAARQVAAEPSATPETLGFSTERLGRVRGAMQEMVDSGRFGGISVAVTRHGKLAALEIVGYQDVESKRPLTAETIFRIASMTKPVTGVAMMMLYEEG